MEFNALPFSLFKDEINRKLREALLPPVEIQWRAPLLTIVCALEDDLTVWQGDKRQLTDVPDRLREAIPSWVISPATSRFTYTPWTNLTGRTVTFAVHSSKSDTGLTPWQDFTGRPNMTPGTHWSVCAFRLQLDIDTVPTQDLADQIVALMTALHYTEGLGDCVVVRP
jgi:hypothetical protein